MVNGSGPLSLPSFKAEETVDQGLPLRCGECHREDSLRVRVTEASVCVECAAFSDPQCEWRVMLLSLPAVACSVPDFRMFSYIGSPDVTVIGSRLVNAMGEMISRPIEVIPQEPRLQMVVQVRSVEIEGELS
jgi:hypothetical protein